MAETPYKISVGVDLDNSNIYIDEIQKDLNKISQNLKITPEVDLSNIEKFKTELNSIKKTDVVTLKINDEEALSSLKNISAQLASTFKDSFTNIAGEKSFASIVQAMNGISVAARNVDTATEKVTTSLNAISDVGQKGAGGGLSKLSRSLNEFKTALSGWSSSDSDLSEVKSRLGNVEGQITRISNALKNNPINLRIKIDPDESANYISTQIPSIEKALSGADKRISLKADIDPSSIEKSLKSATTIDDSKVSPSVKSIVDEIGKIGKVINSVTDLNEKLSKSLSNTLNSSKTKPKDVSVAAFDEKQAKEFLRVLKQILEVANKINVALESIKLSDGANASGIKQAGDALKENLDTQEKEVEAKKAKNKEDQESIRINKERRKLDSSEKKYDKAQTYLEKQTPYDGKGTAEANALEAAIDASRAQIEKVKALLDSGDLKGFEDEKKELEKFNSELDKAERNMRDLHATSDAQAKASDKFNNLYQRLNTYLEQYGGRLKSNTELYEKFMVLHRRMSSGDINYNEAKKELNDLQIAAKRAGIEVNNIWTKLRATFGTRARSLIAGEGWFMISASLRDVYRNVVELDTAMTELKKVTSGTAETYNEFLDNASVRAQELGATLVDVVSASADFARLGYSIPDASNLADTAITYLNVGDDVDNIEQASKSIISTMQGFNIEAENSMDIVDKFNEV